MRMRVYVHTHLLHTLESVYVYCVRLICVYMPIVVCSAAILLPSDTDMSF